MQIFLLDDRSVWVRYDEHNEYPIPMDAWVHSKPQTLHFDEWDKIIFIHQEAGTPDEPN